MQTIVTATPVVHWLHPLIQHLLFEFYANWHNVRHLLLRFYEHQQPGLPRSYYPGYVRFLITHYPRSMAQCMRVLHHLVGYRTTACP